MASYTMPSRLTLTLPPGLGSKTVAVETKRFSIGRTSENDLAIEDTSLSRRHALIENVDGRFILSDCGSSNGTFINGSPVTVSNELSDWDVLTFGGVGDVVVRIQDNADQAPAVDFARASLAPFFPVAARQTARPAIARDQFWLSGPIIAVTAAVIIILVVGLVLLVRNPSNSRGSQPAIAKKDQPEINNDNDGGRARQPGDSRPSPRVGDSGPGDSGPGNSDVAESGELSSIEGYAAKVLTGISKDTHPVLSEKPLAEINAQVQRYKGSSSLQAELRAMKHVLPQVSAAAKNNGLRTPLAVYSVLAQIDKDGGQGDPVQMAGGLCPSLARMRAIFGDELANDSLLSVAALSEGASLQQKITKLAGRVNDSPSTIRSIWYLHDHQIISDPTYNFLLRFIAIGVIAQDPRKFGIDAEPLTF